MRCGLCGVLWLALGLASCADVRESAREDELLLSEPRLRIGVAEGDSAYLLFGAQQALRTSDGRIVIANLGTQQIRIYDAAGTHVRTFGGRGEAPGEFRFPQQLGLLRGDSIAVYDIGLGRITVFSPAGDFARSSNVQPLGNDVLPRAIGFTASGGMVSRTDFDRVFRQGEHRDTVVFALFDATGAPVDTLGRYASEEVYVLTAAGAATRRDIAFGRDVYASARGDFIAIGASDAFAIDVFDASGRRVRVLTDSVREQRVTEAEVRAADAAWVASIPSQFRGDIEKRVSEFPHRDTYPAFGGVVYGEDGSVWVQAYPTPGKAERRWTVHDAAGNVIRRLRATSAMTILDAGADYVLARITDSDGVESILLFDLPAAAPGS